MLEDGDTLTPARPGQGRRAASRSASATARGTIVAGARHDRHDHHLRRPPADPGRGARQASRRRYPLPSRHSGSRKARAGRHIPGRRRASTISPARNRWRSIARSSRRSADAEHARQRLEDMDRLGIDVQAISPNPGQYFYFTDARDRARGGAHASTTAWPRPSRSIPTGSSAWARCRCRTSIWRSTEMRRCVRDLDLRGIEISSNVNGTDLHATEFRPVLRRGRRTGRAAVHPPARLHPRAADERILFQQPHRQSARIRPSPSAT